MNDGARRLRELLAKGLKQQEIADLANVTQPAVSRWLRGAKPELSARRALQRLGRRHGVPIPIDSWDEEAKPEAA